MKIKTSYSNQPVWRKVHTLVKLPKELEPLEKIAKNIWWVWNDDAQNLFQELDSNLWHKSDNNPVVLLENLSYARIEEIVADKALMTKVKAVCDSIFQYGVWLYSYIKNIFRRTRSVSWRLSKRS